MKRIIVLFLLYFTLFASESGITLRDLNGKSFSFDDYIGKKVVLLNFWATWCGPCKKELPIINKIYKKYGNENFMVLSVSLDESSEFSDVRSIAGSLSLKFPVLLDPLSKASDYYNPSKNAPYSILFSSNGKKIKTFLGFTAADEEELDKLIKEEVAKKRSKRADNFSWRFTSLDTYTRYFKDDANPKFSNYEFLTTRNMLSLFYKKYALFASFHTNNFLSTTRYIRTNKNELSDYRMEKIYFSGYLGKHKYILGDYHISQGKGIALSIKKEDDLGIDTTLRGANAYLNFKDTELNIFAGLVNNTNLDIDNNDLYEDKNDKIAGITLDYDFGEKFNISLNYNIMMFKKPDFKEGEPEGYEEHRISVFGGNIEYSYDKNLKFYLEGDTLKDNFYEESRKIKDAYGIYSSLFYKYKKLIFTQEFKRYKNIRLGFSSDIGSNWTYATGSVFYNNPPTLERKGEKLRDIAGNIWGVRSNLKYKFTENFKPYANYLYSMSYAHHDRRTHHFYIGAEYYFNELKSKVDFSISLRREKDLIYDEATKSNDIDNYYGFEFDSGFYVNPSLSMDFKGHVHFTERSLINENKTDNFQDIEFMSTITLFKDIFVSYMYNRYTFSQEVGEKHNYHAFDLKYRFLNDNYAKFFYGSIRGGTKCIGGVCKEYPEFNGFKFELLLAF